MIFTILCKNVVIKEKNIGNLQKRVHILFICKKKDVNIFEELKVFDSLYENYKLKSLVWTKFSAGYIPNEKFPGYITEEKYQNIYF